MAKMQLVNPALPPSKRDKAPKTVKRSKLMARKTRTAAQKAATRRLVALNKSKRKAPTSRKAPKRRPNPIAAVAAAPRKRRSVRRAATSAPRVTRRRNPVKSNMQGQITSLLKMSAIAAGGALTLDMVWGYLPVPDAWKAGPLKHVVKGAGAIAMGMVAQNVVDKRTAENMSIGALTVIMHDAMREIASQVVPAIKMDGMGYYSPGPVMNGYVQGALPGQSGTMGMYMNSGIDERANAEMAGYYG